MSIKALLARLLGHAETSTVIETVTGSAAAMASEVTALDADVWDLWQHLSYHRALAVTGTPPPPGPVMVMLEDFDRSTWRELPGLGTMPDSEYRRLAPVAQERRQRLEGGSR